MRNSTSSAASGGRSSDLEHLPRHAYALGRMVLVAPLADIVEQQRKDQQLRRLETLEQRREALAAGPVADRRSRFRIVSRVCSSTVYLW